MLIQFSTQNHRSIKENAVISFAASKDKSLESYLLHPDEKKALLPGDCPLRRQCRRQEQYASRAL